MRRRVLYLSYDGLAEPLGQAQVLEYLAELAKSHDITLVTFEKSWSDPAARERVAGLVEKAGIRWIPLRYHKRFKLLSAAWDLSRALSVCVWAALTRRTEVFHARGYVPGVVGLILRRTLGIAFIFDIRGFWADQRADCGAWDRRHLPYRLAKVAERRMLRAADAIVSLTDAAVGRMKEYPCLRGRPARFAVIPTCVNLDLFQPPPARAQADGGRPLLVGCVGNVQLWYRFDDMLRAFNHIRELVPEARLLVVNRDDHDYVRHALTRARVPQNAVELVAAAYADVPAQIARMDAGLFFLKEYPSMSAVCPTRLGEFLACGVPVMTNAGYGDARAIVEGREAGVVVRGFDDAALSSGSRRLIEVLSAPGCRGRCRAAAESHFSLQEGVSRYDSLYTSL